MEQGRDRRQAAALCDGGAYGAQLSLPTWSVEHRRLTADLVLTPGDRQKKLRVVNDLRPGPRLQRVLTLRQCLMQHQRRRA